VLEPSAAAIAATSSMPVVEEESSEPAAVMTILFPVHRFWYGWKMWSFAFTATWHACPQSERLGSAVNVSDAAS
jgi:hypothetical protein